MQADLSPTILDRLVIFGKFRRILGVVNLLRVDIDLN